MGVYLYCIGRADDLTSEQVSALDATPVDGDSARLRTVQHGDLAAIVSDTTVERFELERDRLMAHHQVLEHAMTLGDILPVSYGMVASNDRDITERLLRDTADQLHANLEHVRGRVELSLRVMWNQDQLFQEIVDEVPEIRELRDRIAGVPEEQSYYERIRLGEMTSSILEQKNEIERQKMLDALEPLAADIRIGADSSESLLLNGSFLVDREREAEFDEAVQQIAEPRQDRMVFRYLGPLPPANFVSVMVETE